MGNVVVVMLKLGLLVFFVFLIGIIISRVFHYLGFYKRDWALDGIFSIIVTVLGIAFFIVLGISKNSFEALLGNLIFGLFFILGVIIVGGLVVLIRKFLIKRNK